MIYFCNRSTRDIEGSAVQDHLQLDDRFEISLCYMRPCLKKNPTEYIVYLLVLGIEPRISHMLSISSTFEHFNKTFLLTGIWNFSF